MSSSLVNNLGVSHDHLLVYLLQDARGSARLGLKSRVQKAGQKGLARLLYKHESIFLYYSRYQAASAVVMAARVAFVPFLAFHTPVT